VQFPLSRPGEGQGRGRIMTENNHLISFAKQLRTKQTPWEIKLWYYLRAGRFYNLKFKRQVAMDKYIIDFCCNEKKLIIELDGSQHKESLDMKSDTMRDSYFNDQGYKVLRFNNNDVDGNIEGVLETIRLAVVQ
jgi:very-short-patch-repair endonuclease